MVLKDINGVNHQPREVAVEIMLEAGEMLCLDGERQGMQVHCLEGRLWVTQQGDSRDHLLGGGGSYLSRCRGRIVATARSCSRVRIERPTVQPRADWQSALPLSLTIAR
jgi:hypothetical protein